MNRRQRRPARLWFALLLALVLPGGRAFAHDPLEISATLLLQTNRLELRAVMLRPTILRLADHRAVPLLDFAIPSEREEALPMLRSLAGELFQLRAGTNTLRPLPPEVLIGAEDHVSFHLTYPAAEPPLKLDARLFKDLPAQDAYGVNLIVLDMVNHQVLDQKLLNAKSPSSEIFATNRPNVRSVPHPTPP
ncbi:MAG: hypothetical protein U1F65_08725 [Verrucomicrobiota bacterium]